MGCLHGVHEKHPAVTTNGGSATSGSQKATWAQRGGLAPLVLGTLGDQGSLDVHNVAAARQRLDPEDANIADCSAPRTGDGEPSHRGAGGDDRRVHRWGSFLPRPNYVPCPNPSDTCLAGTPISFVL
jgi:hypothetical protein